MSENILTLAALGAGVLATLVFKGYIKNPFSRKGVPSRVITPPPMDDVLSSHQLGLLYAERRRREAELRRAENEMILTYKKRQAAEEEMAQMIDEHSRSIASMAAVPFLHAAPH